MSHRPKRKKGPPWKRCEKTGKRGYATQGDALAVVAAVSRKRGAGRAYFCSKCKRWHTGAAPRKLRTRLLRGVQP